MTTLFESFEFWKLLVCLFGGLLGAFALYYKAKYFSASQKYVLGLLRFSVLFLLLFLILAPRIRLLQSQYDKPIVSLFVDNSESLAPYQNAVLSTLRKDIERFEQLGYDVQLRSFEGRVEKLDSLRFNYQLSPLAKTIGAIDDFYSGQPLEKIVCYTDGIDNTGQGLQALQLTTQVDVVAVGDTIPKHDIKIEGVAHNPTVFKGNDFVLRLTASSQVALGKDVIIRVFQEGKQLLKKTTRFVGNTLTQDVVLRPINEGLQQFEIVIDDPLDVNHVNNKKSIFVRVLKEAEEVLLVYHAPHPDIKMLKKVFETSQNLKLTCVSLREVKLSEVSKYQLMILHGLPNSSFRNKQNALAKLKMATCYWLTNSSDLRLFGGNQSGVKVQLKNDFVKVRPYLFPNQELFKIDQRLEALFASSSPLDVAYGDYLSSVQSKVLLGQRIGNVATDNVLAQVKLGDFSEGVIVGDGFWKMRLFWNFQGQDVAPFDDFLKNFFQLLLRADKENRLLVDFSKDSYGERERPSVSIEVFNDLYERLIDVPVSLKLKAKGGKEYVFNVFSSAGQPFKLPQLALGEYAYVAETTIGKEVFIKKGKVLVKELNLEHDSELAQFNTLRVLASRQNGRFSVLGDIVGNESRAKEIVTPIIDYKEVVDYQFLFYILCLVLFIEWFLRKYFGSV